MLAVGILAALLVGSAGAADVKLTAEDGVRVHANYEAVKGSAKGVVLVHQAGRSATDWRFLADTLNKSGFSTVAVDLRHHGANVPEGAEKPTIEDTAYAAMHQDVAAAVAHLRKEGATEVSLVGASLGANIALQVAGADPEIRNVVMLSPGMSYKGVDAGVALEAYGGRPLFMVVSKDDKYSAKTGLVLDAQAKGPHKLEMVEAGGHGTKMLNKVPGLETMVLAWLNDASRLTRTGETGSSTEGLGQGDLTDISTTGKRMGEK